MVFVPSRTRDGKPLVQPLDHAYWRTETVKALSTLFGGATAVEGFGGWLDEARGDELKLEQNAIVGSFFSMSEDWTDDTVEELREFLYRMGRECRQGAVGFVVNGVYYEIPSERYEQENQQG